MKSGEKWGKSEKKWEKVGISGEKKRKEAKSSEKW